MSDVDTLNHIHSAISTVTLFNIVGEHMKTVATATFQMAAQEYIYFTKSVHVIGLFCFEKSEGA